MKENCQSRILYPVKVSFKNKGEIDFFGHRKSERIHQQIHTTRNVKESPLVRRKTITPGNTDLYKGMKSTRKGNHLIDYIRCFSYLKSL